ASGNNGLTTTARIIDNVLCSIIFILFVIAPGIGAVVITLEGIRWTASADDPGARKKAKEGIIHVIVGLIIVLTAVPLVTMIMAGTERFYACVSYLPGYGDGSGGGGSGGGGSGGGSSSPGYYTSSGSNGLGNYPSGIAHFKPGDYFTTTLRLYEGWNLISIPFILTDNNVSHVFAEVNYDIIYSWNDSSKTWDYYIPGHGGNLSVVELDRGYWIHVSRNATVVLYGFVPEFLRNVSLVSGWNLIGYSGYTPISVDIALRDVNYSYIYNWNSTQALDHPYGVGWLFGSPLSSGIYKVPPKPPLMRDSGVTDSKQLIVLEQGRGYWIYVDRNASWIYLANYPV
ncbi:MAG: pilin, partial [Candidatus Altiarchaeota archaeon]